MNFFSSDITRETVSHTTVFYVISEDSKTESIMIRFSSDHQEGGTPANEDFFLSRNEPLGENWMSILDLQDKNDRITDAVLNELHAALALLEFPDELNQPSLQDYFQGHTAQFIKDTAQRVLTIAGHLLPERPVLCILYPSIAMLLADLMSVRRDGTADFSQDLIIQDVKAVQTAFRSAETELDEARTYVRNVLILPYTEGIHFPPKVIADHYRNFCQEAGTVDFFGKYSSVPKFTEEMQPTVDSSFSGEWKTYLQTLQNGSLNEIRLTSLAQFIHIGIQDLFDREHELRVCELCGNYFNTRYMSRKLCCTRLYRNTSMTCTEYSSHYKFRMKAKEENPTAIEYRRAYNQLYARVRTGKTPADTPYYAALRKLYDEFLERYNACSDDSDRDLILAEYNSANRSLLTKEMQERKAQKS